MYVLDSVTFRDATDIWQISTFYLKNCQILKKLWTGYTNCIVQSETKLVYNWIDVNLL